jgi:hypothetical protein
MEKRILDVQNLSNSSILEQVNLYQKLSQGYSENLSAEKLRLNLLAEDNKFKIAESDINRDIEQLNNQRQDKETIQRKQQLEDKLKFLKITRDVNKTSLEYDNRQENFLETQRKAKYD